MKHSGRNPIRVLLAIKMSDKDKNPYMSLFSSSLRQHVDIVPFSWNRAIFGHYDVVHFHWPEYTFRGGNTIKGVIKFLLSCAFLGRLRLWGVPIFLTAHNKNPHEAGNGLEKRLLQWLERLVIATTFLNEDPSNPISLGAVLLHGEYQPEVVKSQSSPERESSSNLSPDVFFFGQVRPYKGIESLITAFSALGDNDLRMLVAGDVVDPRYGEYIQSLAALDSRISLHLEFLEEDLLTQTLRNARLVVLPYRSMYNSGAVIRALGERTRVLIPASGSTKALQSEVGSVWVQLFQERVTVEDLIRALKLSEPAPGARVFKRRDWAVIAELQAKMYVFGLECSKQVKSIAARRSCVRQRIINDKAFSLHSPLNSPDFGRSGS